MPTRHIVWNKALRETFTYNIAVIIYTKFTTGYMFPGHIWYAVIVMLEKWTEHLYTFIWVKTHYCIFLDQSWNYTFTTLLAICLAGFKCMHPIKDNIGIIYMNKSVQMRKYIDLLEKLISSVLKNGSEYTAAI